jgi:hypothetical protein
MTEYQKVYVVNYLSGPQIEQKDGSDCSGSDGDTSRVLTLANSTTSGNEMVNVDGTILIKDTHYTVSHLGASSTITFTGKIYDTQKIDVRYFT